MRNFLAGSCLAALVVAGCTSDTVDSDEQARRAYLGLDMSVGKSLKLGFDGFNAASNANIPNQTTAGASAGTLTIGGQVDAGTSMNKQMRLKVGMVGYSDGPFAVDSSGKTASITYDTNTDVATQPELDLSLHNFPNGTFTGTLMGTYHLTGDIKGDATLNLMLTGDLMDDGTGKTVRKPGTTVITGTATNADGGMYTVNVTI